MAIPCIKQCNALIGTHIIYIQIMAYRFHSIDSKIIWNQDNKLDFASQFAQQPVIQLMRSHHHTLYFVNLVFVVHLGAVWCRYSSDTTQVIKFTKLENSRFLFINGSGFIGICSNLNFDHVSAYFKHCIALHVYRKG